VIYLLWKGIAQYLMHNDLRYLFGCCSVPATDPGVGLKLHLQLASQGHVLEGVVSRAAQPYSCAAGTIVVDEVDVPPLFKVYLDMGAKVCSEPALDREFGVIDFLIVLDLEKLDPRTKKRLLGAQTAPSAAIDEATRVPVPRYEYRH